MGWLMSMALVGWQATAAPLPLELAHRVPSDGVTVACTDFIRVTPEVFTGRTGAWFQAGGQRDYLGDATFGPGAISIGGIDPARYLAHLCKA